MKEQINKVKTHLKENKKLYITGASCLVVGALGAIAVMQNPVVANKQLQILAYKSKQTMEVWIEALGDPGNIIQDTTTGTIYASQNQAAKALGAHPTTVSRHLHGSLPDVKGHTLTNLGKAMVAES